MSSVDADLILNFCNQYIDYVTNYWFMLLPEGRLDSIKSAYENVIIDQKTGKDNDKFKNMTEEDILIHFREEIIKLLESISGSDVDLRVKKELNKHLKRNTIYANNAQMAIPKKDNLSARLYYYNYLLAKKRVQELSLLTISKVNKR